MAAYTWSSTSFFLLVALFFLNIQVSLSVRVKAPYIHNVHLVFMNHLDVGYNGIPKTGFINNILNTYFQEYFPRAINISQELRRKQYTESFVYTTHPWLVSLYIDCPQNLTLSNVTLMCPSQQDIENFKIAVAFGDITWHAGPMNMQIENMNKILLGLGLNISSDLDSNFNITRKYRTLSQRDVPGMTQAIIPTLVEKGISAVSVGVNSGTSPPAVPRLFRWSFDEKEVIASWHPGGYPSNPGPDPAHPGGLSKEDCIYSENITDALCFAFRTDNSGPPESIQEVLNYYEILRNQFPGASIDASTFENFIEAIYPYKSMLPVVTQEIGDTWIQGIASDPGKIALQRTFQTGLEICFNSGECNYTDSRIKDFVRFLIKLPEHTWGLPSVGDDTNWTNVAFNIARNQMVETSSVAGDNVTTVESDADETVNAVPAIPETSKQDSDVSITTSTREKATSSGRSLLHQFQSYISGVHLDYVICARLKNNWTYILPNAVPEWKTSQFHVISERILVTV